MDDPLLRVDHTGLIRSNIYHLPLAVFLPSPLNGFPKKYPYQFSLKKHHLGVAHGTPELSIQKS